MESYANPLSSAGVHPDQVLAGMIQLGKKVRGGIHHFCITLLGSCGGIGGASDADGPSHQQSSGRSISDEQSEATDDQYDRESGWTSCSTSDTDAFDDSGSSTICVESCDASSSYQTITSVGLDIEKLLELTRKDGTWTRILVPLPEYGEDPYSIVTTHSYLPTGQTSPSRYGSRWHEIIHLPCFHPLAMTVSPSKFEIAVSTPSLSWLSANKFAFEKLDDKISGSILPREIDVKRSGYMKATKIAERRFMRNAAAAVVKGGRGLEDLFRLYEPKLLTAMECAIFARSINDYPATNFENFRINFHALLCIDDKATEFVAPDRQQLIHYLYAVKKRLLQEELPFQGEGLVEVYKLALLRSLFQSAGCDIRPNQEAFGDPPRQARPYICSLLDSCLPKEVSLDGSEHILTYMRKNWPALCDNIDLGRNRFLTDVLDIHRLVLRLDRGRTLLPLLVCWLQFHDSNRFRTLAYSPNGAELLQKIMALLLEAKKPGELSLCAAALHCYQRLVAEVLESQDNFDPGRIILFVRSIFDKKPNNQLLSFCAAMAELIRMATAEYTKNNHSCDGQSELNKILKDYGKRCYSQFRFILFETIESHKAKTGAATATRLVYRPTRQRVE